MGLFSLLEGFDILAVFMLTEVCTKKKTSDLFVFSQHTKDMHLLEMLPDELCCQALLT